MSIKTDLAKKVIIVMGVSGSGKTLVGRLLAAELLVPFIDADDHHPPSNIEKMSLGIPLCDSDREPWLNRLHQVVAEHSGFGCVIACSALKEVYRIQLSQSLKSDLQWVYLKGDYQLILERIKQRRGHFMGTELLRSQFETLEEPDHAINVDIESSPEDIVQQVKSQLV